MQSVPTLHPSSASSSAHTLFAYPMGVTPTLPSHPDLETYTGYGAIQSMPLSTGATTNDMYPPIPTSNTFSTETHCQHYSQEAFYVSQSSSKANQSSTAPFRGTPRRQLVVRWPVPHPYAWLYKAKDTRGRRIMWNHALEKSIFTEKEIVTMSAPARRAIYIASLEAHIDQLHELLLNHSMALAAVPFEKLVPYIGLDDRTAKSMISGLQHDATEFKLKLLELERANLAMERTLSND